MTEASAAWLEAQWKWVQGADDDMLEKHAQDISAFWKTGRRYHIASVSADGKCLRITLPDDLVARAENPSMFDNETPKEGLLCKGQEMYIIIFSSLHTLEFQYKSLSHMMKGPEGDAVVRSPAL